MLKARGTVLRRQDACVVSGSGNVAIYAIEKVQQLGAHGRRLLRFHRLHRRRGRASTSTLLKQIKEVERGRISDYADARAAAPATSAGGSIWDVPCDVALPCATQNELDGDDAADAGQERLHRGRRGRQHAHHPRGRRASSWRPASLFGPGKAANAGGVATSALEMQQNASRDSWTFEHTEKRLHQIMRDIHDLCFETAEEYGTPGNYVTAPTSPASSRWPARWWPWA